MGGFPLAAYGGRADIMSLIAPAGPVYQAGTLSGNPLAVAAGLATLELVSKEKFYEKLFDWTEELVRGLQEIADRLGTPLQVNHEGAIFSLFFSEKPVIDFKEVTLSDRTMYATLFRNLLSRGIYLPPSPFESLFTSSAHDQTCMDKTLELLQSSIRKLG